MGCNSGKVSAPKSACESAVAENTLLGSSGQTKLSSNSAAEVEVPADTGKVSKNVFDGVWTKGVIVGDSLTWADGMISYVAVDEVSRVLEVNFKGTVFTGELSGEGDKIHWSDGDIWDRCEGDVNDRAQPILAEVAFGNSQAFAEIQLADGPEATCPAGHTSQARKNGEIVQFAGAPLPSIPEAARLSPEKPKDLVGAKPVEASLGASPAHTAHSQPLARVTGPDSPNNETTFPERRKASPIQSPPRKEKNWCCC
jgi:hypothetical protein